MGVDNPALSWGRLFHFEQELKPLFWSGDERPAFETERSVLPYGLGRSYGDSCLNENGRLLSTKGLNRFLAFDAAKGILRCEAGVSLKAILELIVPHGWFIPVSPGTCFVTAGGMIANDIHGKNHGRAGTFGRYVTRFELSRSDGTRLQCSPTENTELFQATIGGLGLTGLIQWAEFKLKKIDSGFIDVENVRFSNLDEFVTLAKESDALFEHTVAWVDCLSQGKHLGRGIFMRGNHSARTKEQDWPDFKTKVKVPFDAPAWALNKWSIRAFNTLYYSKQWNNTAKQRAPFTSFFYPLDSILEWNRIYGKRGFFQYQFVIPLSESVALKSIFETIAKSGMGSFLAVLKTFGSLLSPGMLSFPQEGFTLALDFANQGAATLALFDRLNQIVSQAGGRLYPAKDAVMTPALFQKGYPQWEAFRKHIDPKFSSSYWRRVTNS